MKNHHYRKYWIALGIVFIAMVFYFCLRNNDSINISFPYSDKLAHCCAYILLSWWFLQLFIKPKTISCAFILMGILIEFLQKLTPDRSFELVDIAANIIGVILGITFFTSRFKNGLLQIDKKIFAYLNRKKTL